MTTTTTTTSARFAATSVRLDRSEIAKLRAPRAWQIDRAEADRRDANLRTFLDAANAALVEHGDACAVEIKRGEIERVLAGESDEIEILAVIGNDDEV